MGLILNIVMHDRRSFPYMHAYTLCYRKSAEIPLAPLPNLFGAVNQTIDDAIIILLRRHKVQCLLRRLFISFMTTE